MVKTDKHGPAPRRCPRWAAAVLAALTVTPTLTTTAESLCAEVRMEVVQSLTLERQAFEAHMRIRNGLPHLAVENLAIDVTFMDRDGDVVLASSNPNDPNALFFITRDSMTGLDATDGSGSIAAGTTADVYWLIIPAPGAGGATLDGLRYWVGADLSYRLGDDDYDVDVAPDSILVKPMPDLSLDYFLPKDVYGDDAFTGEVEPPVPFSLGLRAKNVGSGTTHALSIDAGQPKIVANELGLLVGFTITGTEINGVAAPDQLQVNLGDVDPQKTALARWIMECSLSGRFAEFRATLSHADELGGQLTSLIRDVRTHTLVHDVLVNAPGRDRIRDFLAVDGEAYAVYESEGVDTPVRDASSSAAMVLQYDDGAIRTWQVTVPAAAGPVFAALPYDAHDNQRIASVVRQDGKLLDSANTWLLRTRATHTDPWEYSLCLFDWDGGGTYTAITEYLPGGHPPYLAHIGDKVVLIGDPLGLGFLARATDGDGTVPTLTAVPLPLGAEFNTRTNAGAAEGDFLWTPGPGEEGFYRVSVSASDGTYSDTEDVTVHVIGRPLLGVDASGESMVLKVFGKTSTSYVVEFNTNLLGGAWEEIHIETPGFDYTILVPMTNDLQRHGYYRAREE